MFIGLINKCMLLPRRYKQFILIIIDIFLIELSIITAIILKIGSFEGLKYFYVDYWLFLILPIIIIPIYIVLGLYRAVLQYMGINTAFAGVKSITYSLLLIIIIMMIFKETQISRSVFIIFWFISIFYTIGYRYFIYR